MLCVSAYSLAKAAVPKTATFATKHNVSNITLQLTCEAMSKSYKVDAVYAFIQYKCKKKNY